MTHTSPTERKSVLFAGLLLLALTPAAWAESLTHSAVKTEEPQKLQLTVGKCTQNAFAFSTLGGIAAAP